MKPDPQITDHDPLTGYVRPKAVCVFRHGSRILVGDARNPETGEVFYCPPGGRIEFGERSDAAVRREIREELATDVENLRLLGVLESFFDYDGSRRHEIVFVYDGELADRSLYDRPQFAGVEANGRPFNAIWLDVETIDHSTPALYPLDLLALLKQTA